MDLLQESSSIWDEFLRRPCPWVDLLSFWPLAPFFPWHPWHLLNSGTLGIFCHLTPLPPFVPWHLWYSTLQDDTVTYCTVLWFSTLIWFLEISKLKTEMTTVLYCTVQLYCTVLYCTILYCTVLYHTEYCYFSCWYTPLNQAIYAWSFRQKVLWGGW